MKQFSKIYVEISNLCNLQCAFCPGTTRKKGRMSPEQFAQLAPKLLPYTSFLYFHIMGEPLCHPQLNQLLEIVGNAGFRVILTTNGTLLPKMQPLLLSAPAVHKVNISLHAFEANDLQIPFEVYLSGCFAYGQAASGQKLTVYRLWNQGGAETKNQEILASMEQFFPRPWLVQPRGTRIADRVFLEYGEKFDWPDLSAPKHSGRFFCYGLRDQLGVLWDGTVVPCCLDHEGDIALGNLFETDLESILNSPRAQALYHGFSRGEASEPLCARCGYARRFVAHP